MKLRLTVYALVACIALSLVGCDQKKQVEKPAPKADRAPTLSRVGTGETGGVYYTAGLALADLVNRTSGESGLMLTAEATSGSVFNINALAVQALEFGFSDEERQYQAVNGVDFWRGMPQERLRFVCSLYPELLAVVVLDGSEIYTLSDLKGKRIHIGPPGSGTQGVATDVLASVGLESGRDYDAVVASSVNAPGMLQKGEINAFFYLVGQPSGTILEATHGGQPVRFLPVVLSDQYMRSHPYYAVGEIPVGLYPEAANKENVSTISTLTVLLTSSQVPDQMVYIVTKALFENLEWYRQQHPVFANLEPTEMVRGAIAPMAPGAEKFYREAGLIPSDGQRSKSPR